LLIAHLDFKLDDLELEKSDLKLELKA